jgi:hypothetical protein
MTNFEQLDSADRVVYDADSSTFHGEYHDEDGHSLTFAVVEAMSTVLDVGVTEIEPLTETLNPDALERLFDTQSGSETDEELLVYFTHQGCEITVRRDGHFTVTRLDD